MGHNIVQIDLKNKLEELSLDLPTQIGFFPENLESAKTKEEFLFTDSMVDLRKLFKQNEIDGIVLGEIRNCI
jgi:hypothetical protein